MNWFDFIALWVGYAVCVLALVRVLIDSVWATHRCLRRAVRWMFGRRHNIAGMMTAAEFAARKASALRRPLP